MIKLRKSASRGLADHGWLKSFHSFSFADYFDEEHMGYSVLRVINEDRIQGGTGFGAHGHRDMEIISYVVEGALEHKDSMGSDAVIKPGDVQRMSAGTGVQHSEQNHLKDKATHFLQIWILPEQRGIAPGYGQKSFTGELATNGLVLVVSRSGRSGSVSINQDVDMYACKSQEKGEIRHKTGIQRHLWVQVIKGDVSVDGHALSAGDGAAIESVENLQLQWGPGAEYLLFDMP